jgi:hypothetical protein
VFEAVAVGEVLAVRELARAYMMAAVAEAEVAVVVPAKWALAVAAFAVAEHAAAVCYIGRRLGDRRKHVQEGSSLLPADER